MAPKIAAFLDFAADSFAAFDPQEWSLTHSGPRREGALRM